MTDKAAALAEPAADLQIRIVPAQRIFDDRQTEPGTAALPCAATVSPVKTLRNPRNIRLRHADTGIHDSQMPTVLIDVPADRDPALCRRVAHCICHQVRHHGLQLRLLTEDIHVAVELHLDLPPEAGQTLRITPGRLDQPATLTTRSLATGGPDSSLDSCSRSSTSRNMRCTCSCMICTGCSQTGGLPGSSASVSR